MKKALLAVAAMAAMIDCGARTSLTERIAVDGSSDAGGIRDGEASMDGTSDGGLIDSADRYDLCFSDFAVQIAPTCCCYATGDHLIEFADCSEEGFVDASAEHEGCVEDGGVWVTHKVADSASLGCCLGNLQRRIPAADCVGGGCRGEYAYAICVTPSYIPCTCDPQEGYAIVEGGAGGCDAATGD